MMTQNPGAPDLKREDYVKSPSDNLPARVVGDWSKDKHYYLKRYIEIFELGVHKKWASRAYIDLFAGPGMCMLRESGQFTDGSPLIALKVTPPFTQYFFSDLDPTAVAALDKRCEPFRDRARITIFPKDYDAAASDIAAKIDSKTICLAFLDPTGLDLKFGALKRLTTGKNMDLIINFSYGMDMKRNIETYSRQDQSKMDDFFDGDKWRLIYERNLKNPNKLTDDLLGLYRAKLAGIGYKMEPDQAVAIKNSRNVQMYALLFASKHPTGNRFWKKIKQIESNKQRGLPFGEA